MKMEFKPNEHATQALSCYMGNISEYKSETIDGKLYIIGTKKSEGKELFTFENLKSSYLLYSLLLLYEALDVHGDAMRPNTYDKKVTPNDLDKIISWCVEYGLPFEDEKLWKDFSKIGFQAASFYSRLHEIYTCYLLWRVIYLHDTNNENYYVRMNTPAEQCRIYLQAHMQTLDVRYVPAFRYEPPAFDIVCPDLMEVAKAQMFIECTVNKSYFNFTIGICEVCGAVFVKTRKNNTLCPACQATKVQRLRAKQRLNKQNE